VFVSTVGAASTPSRDASICSTGRQVMLQARDERPTLSWHMPAAVHVRTAADGSFYAVSKSLLVGSGKGNTTVPLLGGRIKGTQFVAG
jgi:hypothetical protein